MFLATMALNAVSMLAIWPFSDSLGTLVVFSMLNGLANGAFFTLCPVVVASTAARVESGDSGRVAIAMGMSITGWTGGYLMGV
jgi:MFS transporter, MCT family, solute carrier family 16 (monocarboxylic acid transporters), member 3